MKPKRRRSKQSNDFMPMIRLAGLLNLQRQSARQAGVLFAAFALLTAPYADAQESPSPAGAASHALLAPDQPASAPIAGPALRAPATSKIAAPNALLPAPAWAGLTPDQKAILAPLEHEWDALDAARKSQWLGVATRFSALPAEEQARAQERMREWSRLSPAERQQARLSFQGAKKITPDARQAKWEAYQALPPEKRQQLADKAAKKQETQAIKAAPPANKTQAKSNLVPAAIPNQAPKAVAPILLQAKPGATTVLITQDKAVPAHQKAGHTKVLADPALVDSKTLLPKKTRPLALGASAP